VIKIDEDSSFSSPLSGTLVEDNDRDDSYSFEFEGRLENLFIESSGEYVEINQRIAVVYSPELLRDQNALILALERGDNQLVEALTKRLLYYGTPQSFLDQIKFNGKSERLIPIYAKKSGFVSELNLSRGDWFRKGQSLYSSNDLKVLWTEFEWSPSAGILPEEGQNLEVEITDAYGNLKDFKLIIDFVSNQIDPTSGTQIIRASLENKNLKFKPGVLIDGFLRQEYSEETSIWIPESAILWTGEYSLVYLKKKDAFEGRRVRVGRIEGGRVEILEGLRPLEVIVVKGAFVLDANSQLKSGSYMLEQESYNLVLTPELSLYFQVQEALSQDDLKSLNVLFKSLKFENTFTESFVDSIEIADKRLVFYEWTKDLLSRLEREDLSYSIYVYSCPMAFENTSATWLSLNKVIRNPYFGESMLNCGILKSKI
jgi:Cu(I)/Ag(I) efflux system membrane fusion protein